MIALYLLVAGFVNEAVMCRFSCDGYLVAKQWT